MSSAWMTPKPWPFHRGKFIEMVRCIAKRSEGDPGFGDTKLNKLLFRSEIRALQRLGSPISGQRFQKERFGQASRPLKPVRREMEAAGLCRVEERIVGTRRQKRTVVDGDFVPVLLTELERAILDEVIREDWGKTAALMSAEAHEELGWRVAESGEDIPYETLGFQARPLSADEKEYARTLKR